MVQVTNALFNTDTSTSFADNTTGQITPAIVRSKFADIADSTAFTKTIAVSPVLGDDSANTAGHGVFRIGNTWVNTVTHELFICVDATPTAAVWKNITNYTDVEKAKLAGIAAGANVTTSAAVIAAGAVTTSQLANPAAVMSLNTLLGTSNTPIFTGVGLTAKAITLTHPGVAHAIMGNVGNWYNNGITFRQQERDTSWYTEQLVPGKWLGEWANEISAKYGAPGAPGDYYHDTTAQQYRQLQAVGTAFPVIRGNKAPFPQSYVILAHGSNLVILDAYDGSMWMVFSVATGGAMPTPPTSVAIHNGHLCIGTSGTSGGYSDVNFAADEFYLHKTATTTVYNRRTIAERNSVPSLQSSANEPIVNNFVTDVDITVLDNAPIDNVTKMPIPTRIIATHGGLTQLGWDGTGNNAWNFIYSFAPYVPEECTFWSGNKIAMNVPGSGRRVDVGHVLTASTTAGIPPGWISYSGVAPALMPAGVAVSGIEEGAMSGTGGITWIVPDSGTRANGMVNYTGNYYSTGWQVGNIKRAWLAETVPGSISFVSPDRSITSGSLSVIGALTKTYVATGANLCGISGFNASNYLQQGYMADLDFGAGDFHIMGWVNPASNIGNFTILQRAIAGSNGGIIVNIANGLLQVGLSATTTPTLTLASSRPLPAGKWTFFNISRAAGVVKIYLNGAIAGSTANTLNISYPNASMRVGLKTTGTQPMTGSLALLRVGASAPTQTQLTKIYSYEDGWFEAGSTITFPNADSNVLSLSYDTVTKRYHVITAWGHTVWEHGTMVFSEPGNWTKVSVHNGAVLKI